MKPTRNQLRMSRCWERVTGLLDRQKDMAPAYHAAIKKLVSHTCTDGLEMALLFLRSRGSPPAKQAYKDISDCCSDAGLSTGDILEWLRTHSDRAAAMRITREVVEIAGVLSLLLRGKGVKPEDADEDEHQPPEQAPAAS